MKPYQYYSILFSFLASIIFGAYWIYNSNSPEPAIAFTSGSIISLFIFGFTNRTDKTEGLNSSLKESEIKKNGVRTESNKSNNGNEQLKKKSVSRNIWIFIVIAMMTIGYLGNLHEENKKNGYSLIGREVKGIQVAEKHGQLGIVTSQGSVIIPFEYEDIEIYSSSKQVVCRNSYYSYDIFDFQGKVKLSNIDVVNESKSGYKIVIDNDNYGVLKEDWEIYKDLEYQLFEKIYVGESTFYRAENNNQLGLTLYDEALKEVFDIPLNSIEVLNKKYLLVRARVMYGLYDEHGLELLPIEYNSIKVADENLPIFIVERYKTNQLYDANQRKFIGPFIGKIHGVHHDYIIMENKSGIGLMNMDGDIIVEPKYDKIKRSGSTFQLGIKRSHSNYSYKWGLYNVESQLLTPTEFDTLEFIIGDTFVFEKDGWHGSINVITGERTQGKRVNHENAL